MGRGRCHFLGQSGQNLQSKHGKCFYPQQGWDFSPVSLPGLSLPLPQPLPQPSLWVAALLSAPLSFSLHFTCPTLKPLQNSTSAYTSVLICSAPTLGCIPAPFLITLISHTPLHGFSPALLQAHTGPLEPKHVPVPLQSCLIGIFWAENLPCMKNVFFFFFPSMDLLPMGRNLCLFRTLCAFWQ